MSNSPPISLVSYKNKVRVETEEAHYIKLNVSVNYELLKQTNRYWP